MYRKVIRFVCRECRTEHIRPFPDVKIKQIVVVCSCGRSIKIIDYEKYSTFQELLKINSINEKRQTSEASKENDPKKMPLINRSLVMENWHIRNARGVHLSYKSKTIFTTRKPAKQPELGNSKPLVIFETNDIEDYNPKLLRDRECPVCGHKYNGSIVCPKRTLHSIKRRSGHNKEVSHDKAATKEFLNQSHSDRGGINDLTKE